MSSMWIVQKISDRSWQEWLYELYIWEKNDHILIGVYPLMYAFNILSLILKYIKTNKNYQFYFDKSYATLCLEYLPHQFLLKEQPS